MQQSCLLCFISGPFPALCHGSDYPSLGTRCGSKLNQTIYLSGAAWLRYTMEFPEKLLPSESMSLQLSLLIKERRGMGACVRLASLFVGLFITKDGSSFHYWHYFSVSVHSFCEYIFLCWRHANFQVPQNIFSTEFDFFQTSLKRLYAGKDWRSVSWGRILWIYLLFFQAEKKEGEFSIHFETELSPSACPAFLLQSPLTREMPQNHLRRLFCDFKTSIFFYIRSFFDRNASVRVFGTEMMAFSPSL